MTTEQRKTAGRNGGRVTAARWAARRAAKATRQREVYEAAGGLGALVREVEASWLAYAAAKAEAAKE